MPPGTEGEGRGGQGGRGHWGEMLTLEEQWLLSLQLLPPSPSGPPLYPIGGVCDAQEVGCPYPLALLTP